MMKENQKVTFSKELIKTAALKLIKDKQKKDIRISELCKMADVSRDTFYKHYHSIDDVFKEIYSETIVEVKDKIAALLTNNNSKKDLIAYLNYIRGNPLLFEIYFLDKDKLPDELKIFEKEIISSLSSLFHEKDEKENELMASFLYVGTNAILILNF